MKQAVKHAIEAELEYQRAKWGKMDLSLLAESDPLLSNGDHRCFQWLLIVERIVKKARTIWVDRVASRPAGRDEFAEANEIVMGEMRQIAAVAVAAMTQCGSPERVADEPFKSVIERMRHDQATAGEYVLVSTIVGDHFIRIFDDYSSAAQFAFDYMKRLRPHCVEGCENFEAAEDLIFESLALTEWFYIAPIPQSDGLSARPANTEKSSEPTR